MLHDKLFYFLYLPKRKQGWNLDTYQDFILLLRCSKFHINKANISSNYDLLMSLRPTQDSNDAFS